MPYGEDTAQNDELGKALLALGAIGLGLAGFAALSAWERKSRFKDALAGCLEEYGVGLVDAELGKDESGNPVWYVTLNHPWDGILTYHADLAAGVDPYSASTLDDLLERLIRAIPPAEQAWGAV